MLARNDLAATAGSAQRLLDARTCGRAKLLQRGDGAIEVNALVKRGAPLMQLVFDEVLGHHVKR